MGNIGKYIGKMTMPVAVAGLALIVNGCTTMVGGLVIEKDAEKRKHYQTKEDILSQEKINYETYFNESTGKPRYKGSSINLMTLRSK